MRKLFIFLFLVGAAFVAPAQDCTNSIKGKVIDKTTGNPLEFATIKIVEKQKLAGPFVSSTTPISELDLPLNVLSDPDLIKYFDQMKLFDKKVKNSELKLVENKEELPEQMERAISEAISAFGDGSVFIEKYVSSPRHIEIQVLADTHGNFVHLFERECSIQRRHQKVVEEAPSVVLTSKLREAMGDAAIKVAKSCNYIGAGTVEFLLDENNNFYFLEMNTRLQVEHPVSELITGIDLVEQQIKVAKGEKLSFTQNDLSITGHALELRIYAEDPLNNFLPNVGSLETYIRPKGEGIRLDDGYEQGQDIPIYYDPMIAKLITYGKTREEAIGLMLKAINDYQIEGVATTLPFGKFVCEHEAFTSGNFDTHFVKNYFSTEQLLANQKEEQEIAAVLATQLLLLLRNRTEKKTKEKPTLLTKTL